MLGALLTLAEIITSQVLLSQIGSIVLLAASTAFAWRILQRDAADVTASSAEPVLLAG